MARTDKRRFSDLQHSVFLSYSTTDDMLWNRFVTHFDLELNRSLRLMLKDDVVSDMTTYLSGKTPLQVGDLGVELHRIIGSSFAMMIFVHDGYAASQWCWQELRFFRDQFGEEGFQDRLFIIAMSKPAIDKLMASPQWRAMFPTRDPIWIAFYQDNNNHHRPIKIYDSGSRGKEAVLADEFVDPFYDLREKIADQVKAAAKQSYYENAMGAGEASAPQPQRQLHPSVPSAPRAVDQASALDFWVYIESERGQRDYWQPLGQQVATVWDQVVAMEPREPVLRLRPTGLPMHDLHTLARLEDADGVILLWDQKAQESLQAQIEQVEPRLIPPDLPPGLVAYLIEVDRKPTLPVPSEINGWPVVRFATRRAEQGSATVVAADMPKLSAFLEAVLAHRRGGSGGGQRG